MNFTPTQEQIKLAEATFMAMALEQHVSPIVLEYQTKILAENQWRIDRKWVELEDRPMKDEVILDPQSSFLLSDEDFAAYNAKCKEAAKAAKLGVSHEDACPMLVAQALRIDAENALLASFADVPGLEGLAKANSMKLEDRAKAIDLTLKLLGRFVRDSKVLMEEAFATA